jgi:SNF2 family DNA or RNA helicase
MICSNCARDVLRTQAKYMGFKHVDKSQFNFKCQTCGSMVSFDKLIMIPGNILADWVDQECPEPVQMDMSDADPASEFSELELMNICKTWTKQQFIIAIIRGERCYKQPIDIRIKSLMKGTADIRRPASHTKVLIYASYDETLDKIKTCLTKENIKFIMLNGTVSHIAELVKCYKGDCAPENEIDVLLVNSTKYCSGLNLECTTDLIFAHKIKNHEVEAQICGRAMRIGRTFTLNVHYVLYNTESPYFDGTTIDIDADAEAEAT